MKNVIFYQDFNSILDKLYGNCVAVLKDVKANPGTVAALMAVYFRQDSAVCFGEVNKDYLRKYCKRICETKARKIHPNLFLRLDKKD